MHEHHHFHRNDEVQLNEEELRQMAMRTHDTVTTHPQAVAAAAATTMATSKTELNTPTPSTPTDKLINTTGTVKVDPRNDGTLSDSVLSTQPESNKKRRPSMSSKALVILGLSKKTNSASNLGFGKYIYMYVYIQLIYYSFYRKKIWFSTKRRNWCTTTFT